MNRRVVVQWTKTALDSLNTLPPKVRRGLWNKAGELRNATDHKTIGKPLVGPLEGYYRIVYSRYRAIYSYEEEKLVNGDSVLKITIRFVVVGMRKEEDKKDIYRFALRLLRLGVLDESGEEESEP